MCSFPAAPGAWASGSWGNAAELKNPRFSHSATLLSGGKVLVAGGCLQGHEAHLGTCEEATAAAEVYEPAAGTVGEWSATGSMQQARLDHRATLLAGTGCHEKCGQVLVTGGCVLPLNCVGTSAAELYKPARAGGAFSSTGAMVVPRLYHTATLLTGPGCADKCGKVLVAGGSPNAAVAELYDPATGLFTSTGAMSTPRQLHTATLLADGRVLIAGGRRSATTLNTAEIYNPTTGAFTPTTGSMTAARTGHTATLLPNGSVLVAGGGGSLASAEVFDGGTFTTTGSMATPRANHTATLLSDGSVLVTGGRPSPSAPALKSAERFSGGAWTEAGTMHEARSGNEGNAFGHSVTLLSADPFGFVAGNSCGDHCGKMLAVGGTASTLTEFYAPAELPPPAPPPEVHSLMPTEGPTSGGTAVKVTGVGFQNVTAVTFGETAAQSYTVQSRTTLTAVTPEHAATAVQVTVTTPKGTSPATAGALFTFVEPPPVPPREPHGTWASAGKRPVARSGHTATLLGGGKVLIAGGCAGNCELPHRNAELFDSRSVTWRQVAAPMAVARTWHDAVLLPAGPASACGDNCSKVLLVGGDRVDAAASAELYDPVQEIFIATAPPSRREFATATLLSSGEVLVAGGDPSTADTCRNCETKAELYNPEDEEWSPTASLVQGQMLHVATRLAGGDVLVTGGYKGTDFDGHPDGPTARPERYDGASWAFAPEPKRDTSIRRRNHTVTLLASDIGGCGTLCGQALSVGGTAGNSAAVVADTELYDPATNAWSPVRALPHPRSGHAVELLPTGKVLVIGGVNKQPGAPLATAELFDPVSKQWISAGKMEVGRGALTPALTATLISSDPYTFEAKTAVCGATCGKVLVVGGTDNPTTELYTPQPEITSLSVAQGPASGGTKVTLEGFGFTNNLTQVSFGDVAAAAFTVDSYYKLTATTPKRLPDKVPVTVTTDGGTSEETDAASFTFLDDLPPAAVSDLAATASDSGTAVTLRFTPPGEDEGGGAPAEEFVIKQASEPLTAANFDAATTLCASNGGVCRPPTAGDGKMSLEVTELTPETTYYYALKAKDDAGNLSPMSNVATVRTKDVAPQAVTDLAAEALSGTEIKLTFSAPGSNGAAPPPAGRFVVKQSQAPITEDSFAAATTLCGGECTFSPKSVNDVITLAVTGLAPDTTYHYALKAKDDAGNLSAMSNAAAAKTLVVTPGRVTDLTAEALSGTEIKLAFSAVDDGSGAPATSYVVKQSKTPITDAATFDQARSLCEPACSFSARALGDPISLKVTELTPETTYHYALRARHPSGATGEVSSPASARTLDIAPGKVTDLAARAAGPRTIKLTFSAPGSNGPDGPPAAKFIVKQARRPIDSNEDFRGARRLCGEVCTFDPGQVGEPLTLSVTELEPNRRYHYALVALDDAGNTGRRSNPAAARTEADRVPPGRVADVSAEPRSATTIRLTFRAAASDRDDGPAVGRYVVVQSRRPIRGGRAFAAATRLCGRVCRFAPDAPGERITLEVTDLRPATTYYYAVRAVDKAGNKGPRSKSVKATTPRRSGRTAGVT